MYVLKICAYCALWKYRKEGKREKEKEKEKGKGKEREGKGEGKREGGKEKVFFAKEMSLLYNSLQIVFFTHTYGLFNLPVRLPQKICYI